MCSVGVNNVEEEERLLRLLASSLETRSSTCEGARARPPRCYAAMVLIVVEAVLRLELCEYLSMI